MKRSLCQSADGSFTFMLDGYQESYHSINGAYQESVHVYINSGLKYWQINNKQGEQRVNILEIGFGTGLNCLLTIEDALINADFDYYYTGIEKFPLNKIEYSSLNHSALICEKTDNIYVKSEVINASIKMNECFWGAEERILNNYFLTKIHCDIIDYKTDKLFDIIYFDAFSPNTQPELWSSDIFARLFNMLNPMGVLVTYSSKGIVKQALRQAGFNVERLPGINGKRHIVRAIKII